ncbi:MAG: hypothetical protein KW788_00940 [Candidatus Doudnabacteria bacterium]|nr:hypothetical protein [Candidatus Doudnabacteria bacterium]
MPVTKLASAVNAITIPADDLVQTVSEHERLGERIIATVPGGLQLKRTGSGRNSVIEVIPTSFTLILGQERHRDYRNGES